ncbi:unnamed protein product [Phaedon cochleariae]|uniref:WD repeat-containing protein 52 n=1 Tax=Phaedon cochleariae TaxID=80249 RepID=A0A9N9SIA8_PHACE|nr:unnamed protein product [Phaedon cochleariae]
MSIICILKGGAKRLYSNMDYSPDGELLVSQSGEPDYLITVWNWREHKILLRNKSYVNDVYRVKFSPYIPGQITTCGVGHIKFWKMATTFTGLKLKGELGRFGKTEYSDILGVLPMPDSKVVSGCEWGNMLLWDGGLITLEIFRSLRRKCHDAPIVQIIYNEGELWTISLDGHVRIWWYEKIDHADPPDDDRVLLLDPSYDFYTPGLMLYCIEKRFVGDSNDSWYVAQDGNGGIWLIDLNTEVEPKPSRQLYKCHAGEVVDIATHPSGPYLVSLGKDGRIYVYNYLHKILIFHHEFPAGGRCLIWLESDIIKTADIMIAGFDDGQIRVCCLLNLDSETNISLTITQIIKPHNKPITSMSINPSAKVLVSSSEDSTIFVFALEVDDEANDYLIPIGFIPTPDIVTCIAWHPANDLTVIVGCLHGQIMQVNVPCEPQCYTDVSFLLRVDAQYLNFKTYKAQIRRNIKIKNIQTRKKKKIEKKRKDMEQLKKDNPGLEIDEETFLADSESEEKLEPLFIPEIPNTILWLRYTEDDTIWLSMGGYDAGYIYEYRIDQKEEEPFRFQMVHDGDDIEISSYVYDYRKDYLIFAMQDGSIRVNKVNKKDFRDVSDYWTLSMHDNQHGFIPKMCFSSDGKFFFSCGFDGNIFSYKFQPKRYMYPKPSYIEKRENIPENVQDIDSYIKLSLEDTKVKIDKDRIQKAANEHKAGVRNIIKLLRERYSKVLVKNSMLLASQIIEKENLELDPRVTEYIDNEFEDKLKLVERKIAYDLERSRVQMKKLKKYVTDPVDKHPIVVKGINNPNVELLTVRQRVMPPIFFVMMKLVEEKLIEEQNKGRPPERVQCVSKQSVQKQKKTTTLEYFLLSLSPSIIERRLGARLTRMLKKYRQRREKWDKRLEEWDQFMSKKPIPGKNHPDDEKLLMEARNSIGDYKLKNSDDYKPPPHLRDTTVKKYKQVLDARLKQYNLRHCFIQKVWDIRDLKYVVRNRLIDQRQTIVSLNEELPQSVHKLGPDIPAIDESEFPEKMLEPNVILPEEEFDALESEDGKKIIRVLDYDQEEREVLPERSSCPVVVNGLFKYSLSNNAIVAAMESDFESAIDKSDESDDSPFETDIRTKRFTRKLFEQEQTIASINEEIDDYNNIIEEAKKERLPIHVGGNFIDMYIHTLNQELNVLKKFEDGEDVLLQKVNDNLKLVHTLQDEIDVFKMTQEEYKLLIENMHLDEMKIQEKFRHATENNKFYDFLKKVFRKKYKPPRQADVDESSSESSSSSSEESDIDEAGSIDSRDFGIIKQDLNVCPKGCEYAIYNLTVDLRSKRHDIEQAVKEQTRSLDTVKKNIELGNRKMNILQNQLKASQNDLETYQREKQRRLNQVKCTVVLTLDQIYDYNPEEDEITDYLVFAKTTLNDLYKRVGSLQHENYQQRSKYDLYQKHLSRLKKDLGYMQNKVKFLKQHISHIMQDKFGKVVDINEIELAILKKTFHKSHVNELEEVVLKKLEKILNAQAELTKTIKDNTKRLELLQVMSKEKNDLVKVINLQPKKKEQIDRILEIHMEYSKEIKKLENIIQDQTSQLQEMKIEMKMLKTKSHLPKQKIKEEMSVTNKADDNNRDWLDYDKYIDSEEAIPQKIIQEITLPEFHATEVEDLLRGLLEEMLSHVSSEETFHVEKMVEKILSSILRCASVQAIINEIIENIPFEPSPEQQSNIDSTAEKIYQIQEPEMSDESVNRCAREILEETIDEVLLMKGEVHEVILRLVEKLVESIPIDFLLQDESIQSVVAKISDVMGNSELDRENLLKSVDSSSSVYRTEMLSILNLLLERVYGTGIDYMYVVKYE